MRGTRTAAFLAAAVLLCGQAARATGEFRLKIDVDDKLVHAGALRLTNPPVRNTFRKDGSGMKKAKEIFKQQARVLKALANESRLMIVERLSCGECSVGELTKLVGTDQSTVSKHLALLRAHGIVSDRRAGNVVYYSLLTPCVLDFFSCATRVIKDRC